MYFIYFINEVSNSLTKQDTYSAYLVINGADPGGAFRIISTREKT